MNEQHSQSDPTPIFTALMYERLDTRSNPAMGFQSYEKLDGDSSERSRQTEDFLTDRSYNPTLDYPLLDSHELDLAAVPLELIASQANYLNDRTAAVAVQCSAVYRMNEMAWLKEAKILNQLAATEPESSAYQESAIRYQQLNERLYGKPNEVIIKQIYGEIFTQADAKQLDERGLKIYHELYDGYTFEVAGQHVTIPALGEKAAGRLPTITSESLSTLGEVLHGDIKFIENINQSYWDEVIIPRSQANDSPPSFNIYDMKAVFEQTLSEMDPDNNAGIAIQIMPNKSALSWDTPTMTVEIGEKRAPIADPADMTAKITHELWTHGGRAINGLTSDLPVLGTGLYTDADIETGERSDYLTFEEGFATLAEMVIKGEDVAWTPIYVSRYLACASTYDGADFREAFEINWRARVLMAAKSGQPLSDDLVAKEKKQAYMSVVRIRRGTPTQLSDGQGLTFNKDLAYLEGKLVAADYLKSIGNDKAAIRRLFSAKFDPTNHIQDELVSQYSVSTY
ncbi:MAG: tyrosine/phenylalanine carboxypeptidase domain-containing protein [Candidatus Saccharimonadales bacterium]